MSENIPFHEGQDVYTKNLMYTGASEANGATLYPMTLLNASIWPWGKTLSNDNDLCHAVCI